MPESSTVRRAAKKRRQGRSPSTQAGEFVREEIHHVREGKHGARSAKQAIAIGLSKARRAGVDLPPPKPGKVSPETRRQAARDAARGREQASRPSRRRSHAVFEALRHEGHEAASPRSLARQAYRAASRRTSGERSAAARKAARTKGAAGRAAAGRKAARTRARHGR